jgi:arginine/lysine/ornithine decarboxylase
VCRHVADPLAARRHQNDDPGNEVAQQPVHKPQDRTNRGLFERARSRRIADGDRGAPREAFLGRTQMVPRRQAVGRVSAEMICPYPPGIPIVAPGERLTGEVVDYLQQLARPG